MKSIIALCTLFTFVSAGTPDSDDSWGNYKKKYGKDYDALEDYNRRLNFERNVATIVRHNFLADMGQSTYKLGVNKYSDLTHEEISNHLFGFDGGSNDDSPSKDSKTFHPPADDPKHPTSPSVDWRKKGYVTPVKDQGQCGCCWSFSATGALEGQLKNKTGKLVSLSEQNLIDCSQSQGNKGCDGGQMNQAFKYIQKNGGIDTMAAYPYGQDVGKCSYKKGSSGGKVTGYVNIPSGDETALMKAVATVGPISTAFNAQGDFPYYKSGIYDPDMCPNSLKDMNHALLIVGYGTDDGQDYWLAKNCWGTSYGMDGYMKVARNEGNVCGIATKASYPLV